MLFLTFSALVANPKKTTLHGGQSRSWSAEQGKENKIKSLAAYPPPLPARCSFGEKKEKRKRKIRTHLDLLSIPRLGGKNVKTFRWDHRLQIQNLFMAFKRVPLWWYHMVNSIISGRSPPCLVWLCLEAHVSVQYNGGFLPDIILLTQG